MKKNTRILKKICTIGIMFMCAFGLTGCGEKLKEFAHNDLNYAITGRISQNQEMLEKLYTNGFISNDTFNLYNDSMNSMLEYYRSAMDNVEVETKDQSGKKGWIVNCPYLKAVHQIRDLTSSNINVQTVTDDDGKVVNVANASLETLVLSNYLLDHNLNSLSNPNAGVYTNSGVEPLIIIDDDITKDMAERFSCPVYVLNWDLVTRDGNASLDEVINAVNNAIKTNSDGSKNIDTSILSRYFTKAVDENGNTITLMNDFDKDGNGNLDFNMVRVTTAQSNWTEDEVSNKQGYDLIIYQYDTPSFTIQFKEFDPNAFAILDSLVGLNNNKYIYSKENGGAFYIMEYPVWALESISNSSNNDKNVIGTFKEAGIGVNLYTQKIVKYDPIYNGDILTGWSKAGTEISELVDQYLTVAGADNGEISGKSAFIINGKQDLDVSFSIKTTANTIVDSEITGTVQGARIILRDYLEATYAPGLVNEGNLAVFGRKIRLLIKPNMFNEDGTITFNKTEDIGFYVDAAGNSLNDNNNLKITDFCSAEDLLAEPAVVKRLNLTSETENSETPAQNILPGTKATVEQLEQKVVTDESIKIVLMFPGEQIGTTDYGKNGDNDNNSKQRFYAIATRKGIFNSGLYTNWINITNNNASLDWWNQYLSDNNFVYSVGHQEVNNYLLGNFQYEISQSGVVILDLNVVAFIQDEMNKRTETESSEFTRTVFVILGWFLICYASILALAWIIDTNLDLGFDLLTKITFGHWIAVKYSEDIPVNDLSDNNYVSLSRLLISSFIIVAVGILIIKVDIYMLVLALIKTVGSIASQIQKMLSGK